MLYNYSYLHLGPILFKCIIFFNLALIFPGVYKYFFILFFLKKFGHDTIKTFTIIVVFLIISI